MTSHATTCHYLQDLNFSRSAWFAILGHGRLSAPLSIIIIFFVPVQVRSALAEQATDAIVGEGRRGRGGGGRVREGGGSSGPDLS